MNGVLPGPHSFPYRSIPKILLARVGSKVTSAIGKLLPSKQRQRTEYDAILAANRFRSFAPEREGNTVKWFVDGHDYLWAISEAIESAKSELYILDWWLSPELYLRRPPELFPEWRLDALLKRKAEQGVKIYVIVYNEVPGTSPLDSAHSKSVLEALSPNIRVMLVIIDRQLVAIGGMDLCFGRWDTHNHYLSDAHPTLFERTLFPGQDYNNSRVMDFQKVNHFVFNQLSTLLTGKSHARDAVQHFVERWAFVRNQKYPNYPPLSLSNTSAAAENQPSTVTLPPGGTMKPSCKVQVCRSVCDWSHGVPTEQSIQNAYIGLIQEAKHFIYIENQFFISNTVAGGLVVNLIAKALVERILKAATAGEKFKVIVMIPEVPGFPGKIEDTRTIKLIMAAQWRTVNRAGFSIAEMITKAGYDPKDYISYYHLRSYDRINGPRSFLENILKKTGYSYGHAQAALARIWLGAGNPEWDKNNGTLNTVEPEISPTRSWSIPKTIAEAKKILETYESASTPSDREVNDSVGQHALQDSTKLQDERWLGNNDEERNCIISELTYIHSKLMIVDDLKVVIGSANLNDRSMKGDGDSEIVVVVEDTDMIPSKMNGQSYQAARFAATFRRALFKEHLGLIPPQNCTPTNAHDVTTFMTPVPNAQIDTTNSPEDHLVEDPLSDEFLALWNGTAKNNTDIFWNIFRTVPNNAVKSWTDYNQDIPSVSEGHVVANLSAEEIKKQLSGVKGHIVQGYMDFLIEEPGLVGGWEWTWLNIFLPLYI
ncbi:hypothetical protein FRC19_006531 [Serendipita sp. 401]|nr:hypothetical protein FRC19_006531 [Serendipita sp. 401]